MLAGHAPFASPAGLLAQGSAGEALMGGTITIDLRTTNLVAVANKNADVKE